MMLDKVVVHVVDRGLWYLRRPFYFEHLVVPAWDSKGVTSTFAQELRKGFLACVVQNCSE